MQRKLFGRLILLIVVHVYIIVDYSMLASFVLTKILCAQTL